MKILSAEQIYRADQATIRNKNISSEQLMEQAAGKCVDWIKTNFKDKKKVFYIFCGVGNNGGDGLVIIRKLLKSGYCVKPFIVAFSPKKSADFQLNLQRLTDMGVTCKTLDTAQNVPEIPENAVVVDAIFGIGLKRPPTGFVKALIQKINSSGAKAIAIDFPSGLYAERSVDDRDAVIHASHTLTFQNPKMAFLLPENEDFVGDWHILDIGLDKDFIDSLETDTCFIRLPDVQERYKPRKRFSHKGSFGHSLIIGGSFGKIGAAVLATRAASRSGSGLVSAYIPKCGYPVMQTANPEVMCEVDEEKRIRFFNFKTRPTAIGVGPGLGTAQETVAGFQHFLEQNKVPLVIDADGLNILAAYPESLDLLQPGTILTPHPGEFKRLVGDWANDYQKLEKLTALSSRLKAVIVLKEAYTVTAFKEKLYFNSTGNPALATGGSGDVLTGLITGLRAQGYTARDAALLGVYIHGLSADLAVEKDLAPESFIATDLEKYISSAFRRLVC